MTKLMFRNWKLWAAFALVGFWIWRVIEMRSPIGLVLFATSALLPAAALLMASVVTRARDDYRRLEREGRVEYGR